MDVLSWVLAAILSFLPTYGAGIQQLSPWQVSADTVGLASTTADLRIPSLVNCDTIDTTPLGILTCGTDGGGGGGGAFSTTSVDFWESQFGDWNVSNGALVPTTTLGILVSASSTINANATTTGMHGVGSLFINSERFTDLSGDGLEHSGGALIFDCSDVAGNGITCSGEDLTVALGTSISVDELATADFGDWTCNGSACTLDADTVSDSEIDYSTVTLADFTNDAGYLVSGKDWQIANGALSPTTTLGVMVSASSTIGNGAAAGGLLIAGTATSTGVFRGPNGAEAAPTYSFMNDPNTGIDLVSGGILGFIIDGTGHAALNSTSLYPYTNDATALGIATNGWSDLFLASGGVIGWNNGDILMTHSADTLTITGGTTTASNFSVTSAVSILGEYFTNFTTYVRSLFSAGTGISYSSGQFSIDQSAALTWSTTQTFTGATDFIASFGSANSFRTTSNGFEFEGSSADGSELTLTIQNPGSDVTVTIPALTGTVALSGAAQALDFGGATSLEIPNGTGPTIDAIGEIGYDTTDNQFLVATSTNGSYPAVYPAKQKLWGATIASTSLEMVSGGRLWLPPQRDGFVVKEIHCAVDAGTSVVINLSNSGGTTDSETITCDADGAVDTDIGTNNTYSAGSLNSLEIGTITGSVDYLTFAIYGVYTRE